MMVLGPDPDNVIDYIHGYEEGTQHSCNFTALSRKLLTEKYKINYSNDSWSGQIKRLAEKSSKPWNRMFKEVAIEIIANECNGQLTDDLKEIITSRSRSLINQIEGVLYEGWEERWLELSPATDYFQDQLWSSKEQKIIQTITEAIHSGTVFADPKKRIPSPVLRALLVQFNDIST